MVSQDTTLFDDTIKNNIAYADAKATQDEIKEAAKLSFADEFIEKLPNKYETLIGENGIRLSGGEKQRLSIARAILKKALLSCWMRQHLLWMLKLRIKFKRLLIFLQKVEQQL